MSGKLIVIDGIDGAGKGTQVKRIAKLLSKNGIKFSTYKFPDYNNIYGKLIKKFLFSKIEISRDELMMLNLTDMLNKKEKILNDIERDKLVILDRYFTSTIAYQSKNMDDFNKIKGIIKLIGLPRPDLAIFIDIGVDTSLARRKIHDKFEGNYDFLSKVKNNYLELIRENYPCKWLRINGESEIKEITYKILEGINEVYGR